MTGQGYSMHTGYPGEGDAVQHRDRLGMAAEEEWEESLLDEATGATELEDVASCGGPLAAAIWALAAAVAFLGWRVAR